MDINKRFALYPCCILTKGDKRAVISDLQRSKYKLIPLALYTLLTEYSRLSIQEIIDEFRDNKETILSYYKYLLDNDLGILEEKNQSMFIPIKTNFYNPKLITNAIFDYDKQSEYSLGLAINKLEELHCENLEIRLYDVVNIEFLSNNIFRFLDGTSIRNLELLVQYYDELTLEKIIDIRIKNPRISRFIISSSPYDKAESYKGLQVIYTMEKIKDETHCGVIKHYYFNPDITMYTESLHLNNCLNAKIAVDKKGNIKNCPSMKRIWGHINNDSLLEIASDKEFQKIWHIKKDDIKVCHKCEFRYLCQDCRAYIENENDIYSKPLKCNYNPLNV